MQKFKMKTRWDAYNEKTVGHTFTEESKTNKDRQEETEIYKIIEKYQATGIMPKTRNEQPIYMDTTQLTGLTLADVMRQREQLNDYFLQMPAKARKLFGDNPEIFIEKYRQGDFDLFLETGALTNEQIALFKENEIKPVEKTQNGKSEVVTNEE